MAVKQVEVTYYNEASIPSSLGTYPLDENKNNSISFSHEWWTPMQEIQDFLKNVLESLDINFITAAATLTTGVLKFLGIGTQLLDYYAKAWKGPAEPFSISLDLSFKFGWLGIYDAYTEVVAPTRLLANRTLPTFLGGGGSSGYIIRGPGPTPLDIVSEVAGEITGLQAIFPTGADKTEALRKIDLRVQSLNNAYTYLINPKQAKLNEFTSNFEAASKEITDEYTLLFTAYRTSKNVYTIQQKRLAELQEQRDLINLQNTTQQMPRTWSLSMGGYIFNYLVCKDCSFSFHPEIDGNGYPIYSEMNLTFQPYIIALANNIGVKNKTPFTKGNTVPYGWHQ